MDENIVFLGTGGGRFVTTTQKRATGGFRINLKEACIHVDPGPGSLVRARQFKQSPFKVDLLLVSHIHPDHATDTPVMVEAMSKSTTQKKGGLLSSKSVIEGIGDNAPVISKYHLNFLKEYRTMIPGDVHNFGNLEITALKTFHRDESTIGFKLCSGKKTIAYTSDTAFFEGQAGLYKNSDILILNVLRPRNMSLYFHMCTDETTKIIKEAKPKLVVIQHFGMKMLEAEPSAEAKFIQERTGVRTIAAEDGMVLNFNELEQKTLGSFKK